MLTGLKLLMETSLRPTTLAEQQALDEALEMIHSLLEQVRQLSIDLRPQMLDDLGLIIALDWHLKRYSKQTGIQVEFKRSTLSERLPPQLETVVFRIVQEALTNVARHAQVKHATVRLFKDEDRVRIQIEDQGMGFDAGDALRRRASTGLLGMKERAELLGGEFTLDSTPGGGTRLTVELPMAEHAESAPLDGGAGI
jgi:signal transduction histidine kinase